MTDALKALQDQYNLLTTNLPKLLAACQGDASKMDAINTQYAASQANYTDCVNKIFNASDGSVQKLVAQMKEQETAIKKAVANIGAITGVITAITTAVQTGAALAGLAVKG
jgi:hypothetical protein